ncbi:hypothetical protein MGH68_16930 [Erysipelothrix sp. D19-032]
MVIGYASKVKKDPSKSITADLENVNTLVDAKETLPEFTTRRKWSAFVLIMVVIIVILGYFPWADLLGQGVSDAINAPFTMLAKVPVLGDILEPAILHP